MDEYYFSYFLYFNNLILNNTYLILIENLVLFSFWFPIENFVKQIFLLKCIILLSFFLFFKQNYCQTDFFIWDLNLKTTYIVKGFGMNDMYILCVYFSFNN